MGVHGLWKLIEPSGKPVPLETFENKILAIDVSIWLHQAIKGFQDSKGAAVPNAHLLGIYHRICKLLYYRIHPVFVFDGGVPVLKKETIAKRNSLKTRNLNEAYSIQKQLLNTLLKHSAINKVISEKAIAKMENCTQKSPEKTSTDANADDIYKLPLSQSESLSEEEEDDEKVRCIRNLDLHTIDEKSVQFKSLPADVRHEILTELKETRKQSSWGRIHELPTHSDDFSVYQMKRLLKRHSVQISLEETEKEMGGHTLSLGELETLLNDHGVITSNDNIGSRIASNESTKYLLIKDVKKALEEATSKEETIEMCKTVVDSKCKATESEYESDLKKAIQLSLQDVPSTSKSNDYDNNHLKELEFSKLENFKNDILNKISITENLHSLKRPEEGRLLSKKQNNELQSDAINESIEVLDPTHELKVNSHNNIAKFSDTQIKIAEESDDILVLNKNIVSDIQENKANTELAGTKDYIIKKTNCASVSSESVTMDQQKTIQNVNFFKSKPIQEDKENTDIELMSDSNSDSDENFIEVDGLRTQTITSNSKKTENILEIVIKPKETLEEDIFADIFSSEPLKSISDLLQNEKDSADKEKSVENQNILNKQNEMIIVSSDIEKKTIQKNETSDNVQKINLFESLRPKSSENIPNNNVESSFSVEELQEMKINLIKEKHELIAEKSNKERLANNVTDQMYQDAQELLQLFGVPYIVAPMEAEAQCAFLDQINLTDGTITDDSDIWLFGGRTVYKNFFNQSKHVMKFCSENIEHSFKLSRYEMILLALLVGSDYTTGIQGVGPVTALEILAAFPIKKTFTENALNHYHLTSGLQEFQKWFKQGKVKGPGRTTLRNKLKNIVLNDNFPSLQVVQAYLEPTIEKSRENFSWSKPDIVALVDFARKKFGWTKTKSEEILKPVLKQMEENSTQTKITNYFKVKHKIDSDNAESKMSKRVKSAVNKMGKQNEDLLSDEDEEVLKQVKKQSRKKVKQIESELQAEMEKQMQKDKLVQEKLAIRAKIFSNLHKEKKIPQKEQDKTNFLRSKLKAIETFRKSKQGPGYVTKRQHIRRAPKEDAELSESSSD